MCKRSVCTRFVIALFFTLTPVGQPGACLCCYVRAFKSVPAFKPQVMV